MRRLPSIGQSYNGRKPTGTGDDASCTWSTEWEGSLPMYWADWSSGAVGWEFLAGQGLNEDLHIIPQTRD